MNTILEEVFLHSDVRGGYSVGFQTYGAGDVGDRIGYIVKHQHLGHVLGVTEGLNTPYLSPSHLKTIAKRLQTLNERQEKARQTPN